MVADGATATTVVPANDHHLSAVIKQRTQVSKSSDREVFMNFTATLNNFLNDESGQGITEYGAILAFVALLVAVVFSFASGTLTSAISQSFSTIVYQLNKLNSVSANGGAGGGT